MLTYKMSQKIYNHKSIENLSAVSSRKHVAMHSLRCILTILMLSVAAIGKASDADVERLIKAFDGRHNQVEIANRFFKQLKSQHFIDEDIVFTSSTPLDSVRQTFYYWAGEWYSDRQDYAHAKQYGLKALPFYKGGSEAKADCLNLLGYVYVRLGDFATGVTYTKQCLDLDLKSGDNDRIASSFSTLAGTYIAAADPDAALKYSLQGLKYASKARNSLRKTILMGMVSEAYYKKGEYTKAVKYADEAYRIDSIDNRQNRAAIRLSQKATALVGLEKYAEAETTFLRAFPILIASNNYHSLAIDYNQLGFMLLKQKRNKEAITYFLEASKLFDKMGDLYNQVHSQRGLYESYWHINQDSAHIALQRFNVLKDSLYRVTSADALTRYKVEFETDRLKEEVNEHIQNRKRDLIIAGVLLLLCIVGGVVLYRWRMKCYRHEMQSLMAKIEEIQTSITESSNKDITNSQPTAKSTDAISEFERMVIEAVNEGLPKGEFSVSHIASRMNMGEQTFRRRFLEATGKLPKAFISAIQMNRAVSLLRDSKDMTIAEVARECGFEELSAFSRSFKRSFGRSPSEYRSNAGETSA